MALFQSSQSSRLGCRESNSIVFPATCAAEKLPEARRDAAPSRRPRRASPAAMEREYLKQGFLTKRKPCFIIYTRLVWKRIRIVAIWARAQSPFGSSVVGVMPLMRPRATAQ